MRLRQTRLLILSDLKRFGATSGWEIFKKLIATASFKVTFWFRVGTYLQGKPLLRPLALVVWIVNRRYQYLTGIDLPVGTTVGEGLLFAHFSCIIINNKTVIGDHCTIFQGVTIGSIRGREGFPVIGDRVVIASGAKILGNPRIGNDVFVAANAVVTKDVPDGATVAGIPARIINMDGARNVAYYI